MAENESALFELDSGLEDDGDNVTDWCLQQFHSHYGDDAITKDDIWEYLYGVMHAPDWRERYAHDLQRSLPRVPLAADFEAFRIAGRELMDLHVGYETCPEADIKYEVDGITEHSGGGGRRLEPSPEIPGEAFRIAKRMRLKVDDTGWSALHVNDHCRLVDIPPEAHEYKVSGRSPLAWAVDSLRYKHDKKSDITDDPNRWHVWAEEPFELIRHLRRLIYVGMRSTEIIAQLPPSLSDAPTAEHGTKPSDPDQEGS